jgi:hypothetical protein
MGAGGLWFCGFCFENFCFWGYGYWLLKWAVGCGSVRVLRLWQPQTPHPRAHAPLQPLALASDSRERDVRRDVLYLLSPCLNLLRTSYLSLSSCRRGRVWIKILARSDLLTCRYYYSHSHTKVEYKSKIEPLLNQLHHQTNKKPAREQTIQHNLEEKTKITSNDQTNDIILIDIYM